MAPEFDIIICGAGPAGCTAALTLGSSGLKVAMIDKMHSPGGKPCGDAIPAYVPKVLNTIDSRYATAYEDIAEKKRVNICRIIAPDEKSLDLKFAEYGYICKRRIFDRFLFDMASELPNLTVIKADAVSGVNVYENSASVETKSGLVLTAKLVIGCDGARSIVRRKLMGEHPDLNYCSSAVRGYFRNVKGIPESTYELHFMRDYLPGYFWIFPLPDNQANVGLGIPSKFIAAKKINLMKELLRIIETTPSIAQRFSDAAMIGDIRGYLLPLGSQKNRISGNRLMLCGDAASLIDPATGGGIGQAMVSGRYSGWQAIKCFNMNNFSGEFMKAYDNTVYDKLWQENHRHYLISKIISLHPSVLNLLAGSALKSKSVYNMIIKACTL